MLIELTWQEQLFAMQAGGMRRISALARNRREQRGQPPGDLWGNDIEAAGAEAAVAKAMDRYWLAVHSSPHELSGDVGKLQVRSTQRPDGRLIVHDSDSDDAPFVLVRGVFPTYDVVGWIYGKDAKQERFLFGGDGRPAYFVPDSELELI